VCQAPGVELQELRNRVSGGAGRRCMDGNVPTIRRSHGHHGRSWPLRPTGLSSGWIPQTNVFPLLSSIPRIIYPPPQLFMSFAKAHSVWIISSGFQPRLNSRRSHSMVLPWISSCMLIASDIAGYRVRVTGCELRGAGCYVR